MGGIDISSKGLTLATDSATAWGLGQEGPGLKGTVASSGLFALAPASYLSGNQTLYWRGYIIGNSSIGDILVGTSFANTDSTPFLVYSIATGSGGSVTGPNLNVLQWNTGGTFASSTDSGSTGLPLFTAGTIASVGGTFAVGGNATPYNNGVARTAEAFGASGPTSGATSTFGISTYGGDRTRFSNAVCHIAMVFNVEKTAAEMALLHNDPYGFLLSAEGEMPAIFLPASDTLFAQVSM